MNGAKGNGWKMDSTKASLKCLQWNQQREKVWHFFWSRDVIVILTNGVAIP